MDITKMDIWDYANFTMIDLVRGVTKSNKKVINSRNKKTIICCNSSEW